MKPTVSKKKGAARAAAAQALYAVLEQKRSLSAVLPEIQSKLKGSDKGWVQAVCFQVLRELPRYEWIIQQLMDKPLKKKVRVIHSLLLVGVCQFRALDTPAHAALAETVEAARLLKQKSLTGLVNGVLRSFQRQQEALEKQVHTRFSDAQCFPRWLMDNMENAWPKQSGAIFTECLNKPPMWLRVNTQKTTAPEYMKALQLADIEAELHPTLDGAIRLLSPTDVKTLPNFLEGFVSVQDVSAQWAAHLLEAQAGERVLDACAAPGGKTAHIFELQPRAQIDAIEIAEARIGRMEQNFERLDVTANIICADANDTASWWDGELYDRILLDAPCSATGVVRRHPDIKWLRNKSDIQPLVELQNQILSTCWEMLAPGGRLVYATCSLLPEENSIQIENFLAKNRNANYVRNSKFSSVHQRDGQILPGEDYGDGFFYAILEKTRPSS